ncbi:MAG UNVERIFIED_CONTAM: hypothetical protein LVQ98_02845 [Rickettsiaceae bacterium]|jgi:hypothetical protein
MSQIQRIIELINKLDSTELVEALNACNIKTFDLMTKYPELGDKSLMGFALPLNKLGPLLKSDIGGEIPDEQIPILAKFLISRSGQFVDVFSAPEWLIRNILWIKHYSSMFLQHLKKRFCCYQNI